MDRPFDISGFGMGYKTICFSSQFNSTFMNKIETRKFTPPPPISVLTSYGLRWMRNNKINISLTYYLL